MWPPPVEYYTYAGLVNFVSLGLFCLFVRSRRPDLRVANLYCWFSGFVAAWSLCYAIWLFQTARAPAEFWLRTCMVPVAFIAPSWLHFVGEFTQRPLPRWALWAAYGFGIAIAATIYTPAFAVGPSTRHLVFPFWLYPGPVFPFHAAGSILMLVGGLLLLLRAALRSTGSARSQLLIVCAIIALAYPSGAYNYAMWYRWPWPPVATPFICVVPLAVGYAVVRHKLFDMDVIIKRTVVFAGLSLAVLGIVGMVSLWLPAQLLSAFGLQLGAFWPNTLAAVLIAAGYSPLRSGLVNVTDRYLFQKKYDYTALLKRFTDQVMSLVDLRQLVEMTVTTLAETMKLEGCALWLREPQAAEMELAAARAGQELPRRLAPEHPLVQAVAGRQAPLVVDGPVGDATMPPDLAKTLRSLRTRLVLPIVSHEQLVGLLSLGQKKSDEPFTQEDLDVLKPLGATLAIAISNARLFVELERTQAEVAAQEVRATTDALTGLLVRRAFLERAATALGRTQQAQQPASVLMIDLDHFKQVNDTHGHPAGDGVLQETARRVRLALRDLDLLGRYGGEELIALLPAVGKAQAVVVAERIRQSLAAVPIQAGPVALYQTLSIGIATAPEDGLDLEHLMARADQALYAAKRSGRNRVMTEQTGGGRDVAAA